jgi:hypothetical protein
MRSGNQLRQGTTVRKYISSPGRFAQFLDGNWLPGAVSHDRIAQSYGGPFVVLLEEKPQNAGINGCQFEYFVCFGVAFIWKSLQKWSVSG